MEKGGEEQGQVGIHGHTGEDQPELASFLIGSGFHEAVHGFQLVLQEKPHPLSHSHTHQAQVTVKMKEDPGEGGFVYMAAAPVQQGEFTDQRQGGGV